MSDFFTRLIGRSLGSEDVVRPRPISIFEPPPLRASTFAEPSASFEATAERERQPINPSAEPSSSDLRRVSRRAPDETGIPRESRVEGILHASTLPSVPAAVERRFSPPVNTPTAEILPIVDHRETAPDPTVDVAPHHEPLHQLARIAQPLAVSHDPTSSTFDPPEPIALALESVLRQPLTRRQASADSAVVTRTRPDGRRSDHAFVPEEPTVHVTIGRVEIRAIAPDAPRRKDPKASPVMGLDEYLRAQRGGAAR